ncbi:aldolase [bacterium]|nr:aldolase [bacterium]
MTRSRQLFDHLKRHRLIALLAPGSAGDCLRAYEILYPLGIVLEIAFRTDHAAEGIAAILQRDGDALIMAGTVMTGKQAEAAIAAGVSGVVSADYIPEVVEACIERDVLCAPGGLNDAGKQLVQKAALLGCSLDELREQHPHQWIYKLFPAVAGGLDSSGLAGAWRGPYRDLTVIYTGGVNATTLGRLYAADPSGIFCGSALTKDLNDPEKVHKTARVWLGLTGSGSESAPAAARTPGAQGDRVVTFGEIMLRLSPPGNRRFTQTDGYEACFGGAEANAAAALAAYGLPSRFVTALPDNEIGQSAVNALRSGGVDTSCIVRQGKRTGIYFLEHGASQRPSKVIYDRAGSAVAELQPGTVDWGRVFTDARWFHWSGITPALSDTAAAVTLEALRAAKEAGCTVSVDLNYRAKLWSREQAKAVMAPLMAFTDICIGNEEDADAMFGITSGSTDLDRGTLDTKAFEKTAAALVERFGLQKAAITLRESHSASENSWSACLHSGGTFITSSRYTIRIVDRVGGGDSFSSGLIYGLITGMNDREALEFGVAASCLKQTIPGDFNRVSVAEVKKLMAGSVSGRVQR